MVTCRAAAVGNGVIFCAGPASFCKDSTVRRAASEKLNTNSAGAACNVLPSAGSDFCRCVCAAAYEAAPLSSRPRNKTLDVTMMISFQPGDPNIAAAARELLEPHSETQTSQPGVYTRGDLKLTGVLTHRLQQPLRRAHPAQPDESDVRSKLASQLIAQSQTQLDIGHTRT